MNLFEAQRCLELKENYKDIDITMSYKRLVRLHHPDHGGDSEKFQKIIKAYEFLKSQKKKNYNTQENSDVDDIWEGYGNRRANRSKPNFLHGENVEVTIEIDFIDSLKGMVKNISYVYGFSADEYMIELVKNLECVIPMNVIDGTILRYAGEGKMGSPPGDLFVTIKIKPSDSWSRDGDLLVKKVHLPFYYYYIDGEHSTRNFDGSHVKFSTKKVKEVILKECGMKNAFSDKRMDLKINIIYEVVDVGEKSKKLIEEIKKIEEP